MSRFNHLNYCLLSAVLVLPLAAACGAADDPNEPGGGGGGPDASVPEPLVNGVPASQFYGQFAWETTDTGVDGAVAFAETDGRNAFLAQFFLMPGGDLELFYGEGEGTVSSTGWSLNIDTSTQKRRTGTWRVEGTKLVLANYMTCDGLELNDKPALTCTLTSTIVTPAAQGRSGMFKKRFGASSPDDSEFSEFTP